MQAAGGTPALDPEIPAEAQAALRAKEAEGKRRHQEWLLAKQSMAEYIEDLRDDDVRFNAGSALVALRTLLPASRPALEAVLDSDDYQQRQYATFLLLDTVTKPEGPSPKLWRNLVEGLGSDEIRDTGWSGDFANATDFAACLLEHGDPAVPHLLEALHQPNAQRRLLAAAILAWRGDKDHVAQLCEELLPHLNDNQAAGDARIACSALVGIGRPALPFLREASPRLDVQGRELAEYLIAVIHDPSSSYRLGKQLKHTRFRCLPTDPDVIRLIDGIDICDCPQAMPHRSDCSLKR
ncbi:MAG: hypothetical protein R3F17_05390 [Planctomycetota bacterium]